MGYLFAFPVPPSFHGYEETGNGNQKEQKPDKQIVKYSQQDGLNINLRSFLTRFFNVG